MTPPAPITTARRQEVRVPPTSHGIAIGRAHLLVPPATTITRYWIAAQDIRKEVQRFRHAVRDALHQLNTIRSAFVQHAQSEPEGILETHLLLLADPALVEQTVQLIQTRAINAEWAVEKIVTKLAHSFLQIENEYLQQRRADIEHVGRRLLRQLLGTPTQVLGAVPYKSTIVCAIDLSPAEVATLPRPTVCGFITTKGASTSHTAIIARSLGIPALIGLRDLPDGVHEGDTLILDADAGVLVVHPTAEDLVQYRAAQKRALSLQDTYDQERDQPAQLADQQRIVLCANLELLNEVPIALSHGAEQIGLYRTEYLFMNRSDIPDEAEQMEQYRRVLADMGTRPVTIRTLDLGGDKLSEVIGHATESNPALGLRSLRFCLRETQLFRTQLRALYRASIAGHLRLLIPMVTTLEEWQAVNALITQVQSELQHEGVPFDPNVPVGIMIEVPSAAMMADHLARTTQFFCIGTNDLTQYTLAVDRTNEHVAHLFRPHHPAVLRLLHHIIGAATKHRCPVTICGEMAGDPLGALLLIGLGITSLSMNSIEIPRMKRLFRQLRTADLKLLVARALQATTSEAVETLVREYLAKQPKSVDTLRPLA